MNNDENEVHRLESKSVLSCSEDNTSQGVKEEAKATDVREICIIFDVLLGVVLIRTCHEHPVD